MTHAFSDNIAAAIAKAKSGEISAFDIEASASNPLPAGLLPEELYLLVCFVRHERLQKWVGFIVESRLSGKGADLAHLGAFAHAGRNPAERRSARRGRRALFHL
jgi:hypothetical protein